MRSRLFCYGRHYDAVMAVLNEAGLLHDRFHVVRIDKPYPLAGLDGATFVYVENHPTPVPYEMLIAVRTHGLVEMKLNTEAARARHRRAEFLHG
ncbi:hypothetical protein BjapCC829_21775 [Bradyrhizobium barranii]|uniref:Uncharacterized protein n=1 Tax=Bradyrhizobium barranii TaxID=2992140 RepID=A0ABY3QYA7_9BRAD|nr:hypothetical protein [Bradyrhizobium japonicum]UFW91022.1 hypothetical protein BjapCC829_21775 [Bradyrhizobium japonicum]